MFEILRFRFERVHFQLDIIAIPTGPSLSFRPVLILLVPALTVVETRHKKRRVKNAEEVRRAHQGRAVGRGRQCGLDGHWTGREHEAAEAGCEREWHQCNPPLLRVQIRKVESIPKPKPKPKPKANVTTSGDDPTVTNETSQEPAAATTEEAASEDGDAAEGEDGGKEGGGDEGIDGFEDEESRSGHDEL